MRTLLRFAVALVALTSPALGQQEYVSRYDVFAGYSFLNSPSVGLFENGFEFQIGVRPKTWYSLGFDYSISAGDLNLTPDLLTPALQLQLGTQLQQLAAAGLLPPGFSLSVPTHSRTQTFAAGPQFSYRRLSQITLFVRPSIGAIYEVATPHPADPIATAIAAQLAPSGNKTDWTGFYGFGGGADLLFSKHLAVRVQADLVHDHLFSDLLQKSRWTTRFSVGPAFNFGRNIVK
ncbi:MAG: hypothetical protein JWO20_2854 [Candidatus Angelobacter sp.]|jgi:hypothetical protein|nr:hypothetical protein [Candidatus Angelobacter sp.]